MGVSSKSGFPEWGKKAALGRESGGGGEGEHAELGSKHKQRLCLESFPIKEGPSGWEMGELLNYAYEVPVTF